MIYSPRVPTVIRLTGELKRLTYDDYDAIESYWHAHTAELLDEDRMIEERSASRK